MELYYDIMAGHWDGKLSELGEMEPLPTEGDEEMLDESQLEAMFLQYRSN